MGYHKPMRHAALVLLVLGAMVSLDCRKPKQIEKNPSNPSQVDTGAAQDTSKSFLSQQYDSLSHKFTSLFSQFLPRGKDTTKGYPVLTTPPPEVTPPIAGGEVPGEPGFLKTPIKREVQFDSSGNVTQRDVFLGTDIRTPVTTPFDEYLHSQEDQRVRDAFEASVHKEIDTGKVIDQQTGILGDYNTISIPIPPSIVPTIFGRPSINLRVNGDVAIHLAYRDQQTYATAGANFFGSETGLNFKQEINVSTNGTIGDKLKIGADWGSDRMFQYDNLLKFNYKGFPDEILQEFDAGNVTFTTPSQYIGLQQDLFGLKAVTRFGPVYITTVAAQKKGERQTKSYGGASTTEHVFKPWDYRRNRFWLDTSFIKFYEPYYATIPPNTTIVSGSGQEYIGDKKTVQVWVQSTNLTDPSIRYGVAYYSLPAIGLNGLYNESYRLAQQPGAVTGNWIRLDTNRYTVDEYTGVLVLNQEPDDNLAMAVSYQTYRNGAVASQYGEGTSSDTIVLKLLKPMATFKNPSSPEWKNIVKSTYYIGGINFDAATFSTRIIVTAPGGHQHEYLPTAKGGEPLKTISIMGLDRYNNTSPSSKSPDGLIDFGSQFTNGDFIVDPKTGTLIFPYLEPFGSVIANFNKQQQKKDPTYKPDSSFYLPEIYTTEQETLRLTETSLTSINVKFTGGVSATLNLGAFNLVEGSVRVTIGATQLVEGTDFRVDYNSGTVTILNTDLLNTGQINVEYDVHDIFTNATKNILAMRAEVPLFDDEGNNKGAIGTTFMNYSMSLPTLKTRQGEEPLSNWVIGMDGGYKFDAPFLTDALNALPIFNLKDKSELDAKIDAAISLPNPNTEKSPMAVDNGASIAYLDDFEGGLNEFPLYLNYGRWVPASQPADSVFLATVPSGTAPDSEYWNNPINQLKGKTRWGPPTAVNGGQLVPQTNITNQQTAQAGQPATTMNYLFDPTKPGIYNPTPNAAALGSPQIWGGMMQYAPGLNVAATNTDAIQLWVKIDDLDASDVPNAKLKLDIGQISEDIIPDKRLENEDRNANGRYDPGEDVGLDGLTDAQEQQMWPGAWNKDDPSNDNYTGTFNGSVTVPSDQPWDNPDGTSENGQEGNENDAFSGLKPDNEDLNSNGAVDLTNGYYEYEIPLSADPARNPFIIGHGNQDPTWFQMRIPLADYKRIVGTQDSTFSNINYYRIWTNGYSHPVQVELFAVMLVGSQWTRGTVGLNSLNPISDTSLKIDYVDLYNNSGFPTFYYPPPGAQTTLQPSATTYIPGDEQSLRMHLVCINDTGRREAQRLFPSPNDLFNYQSMAIWVHGDSATIPNNAPLNTVADTNGRVWVYWRFGSDQYDYYEYRRPLIGGWQNLHVDFNELTNLKVKRKADSSEITEQDPSVPFAYYTVVGSPTLTDAPYFVLGVQNMTHQSCLTTDVWWDELRLLQANDQAGLAWNGSTELKLAEFGKIDAGIVDESADFHRVDERFNTTRSTNFNWNVTGVFGMEKILPKWMEDKQSKLPLTVSHAESIITPKYIVNTDENLANAITTIQNASGYTATEKQNLIDSLTTNNQTLQVKNSIGLSDIALRFPGSFFLLPAFVNRLDFGFGYGEAYLRSPQYQYDYTWSWTASARYSLPPLPGLGIMPLTWWGTTTPIIGPYSQWKINLLPSNVSFAVAATRGRDHSLTQLSTLTLPPEGTHQDTLNVLQSRVPLVNRVFTATRGMQINWKPFEGGLLSPAFDYSLDVSSNLVPLETYTVFNKPTSYDANGDPIYNYDSVYYYQRSLHDIESDIFLKNGALVRPGIDFNESQKVHMGTSPRLPGLFGVEKLVRPVFDYRVEYKWLNAQTGLQNAKQSAWNNTITTGLEFNLRDLGILLFGKPLGEEPPQRGRGRERERGELGVTPEELPNRGGEERESPPSPPNEEPRNQVERGEHMRPQARPNPLGRSQYITDTLHTPGVKNVPTPIDTNKVHSRGVGTQGEIDREYTIDTTLTPEAPPVLAPQPPEVVEEVPETPPITFKQVLQNVIQKPLFDWNGTRLNFTQTNSSLNNALAGDGPGITNFLARGFFAPEDDQNGPSRAYQLGLITDPAGRLLFHWNNAFPWLTFSVRHGLRAPDPYGGNVDVTDAFNETNNFELTTSRPLWSGASINLNWKVSFGYAEQDALRIDQYGYPNLLYTVKSGDISRTFFSIPPLPFIGSSILQSGILRVGQKYDEMVINAERGMGIANPTADTARFVLPTQLHNQIEQNAFMQGFETLPFFTSWLREYLPRLNYSFSWTGMEKFPLFSFADHVGFRSAYTGTYRRSFNQNPGDTLDLTTLQTIVYGFRPLIALDMSWDKLWNGRLTSSVNYDSQTEWAADYASTRITKRLSTTVGVTANYSRQGLVIPFLKLNLKNEFGASFTLSETISEDSYYNFWTISTDNPGGISNGGLTKTTIEPRVTYNVSQQLTMEAFYHYERTTPAASGLISPPTRLIEAGFDIKLKIQ